MFFNPQVFGTPLVPGTYDTKSTMRMNLLSTQSNNIQFCGEGFYLGFKNSAQLQFACEPAAKKAPFCVSSPLLHLDLNTSQRQQPTANWDAQSIIGKRGHYFAVQKEQWSLPYSTR